MKTLLHYNRLPINTRYCFVLVSIAMLLLTACSDDTKTYRIGVSQCGAGRWREKVNNEMLAAQHLYEHNAKVIIACAYDDTQRQIQQIDSLADSGIDLLVVAPNESAPLAEAISRTQKKGIPVVYFDRKAATDEYTAFIGGNNEEAGQTVGEHVLTVAKSMAKKPVVLEVTGAMSSSPAQERHKGFARAMEGHNEVKYICKNGDWTSDEACRIVEEQIKNGTPPDIVFCHNDGMATGAYKAIVETDMEGRIKIIGIDGLPDEGIEYVQFGHQIGTYVYPTHGEEIIRLALDILTGRRFERDNTLSGYMVTPENAELIAMGSRQQMKQNADLITIHDKLENYFGLYNSQRKILVASVISILLLIVGVVLTLLAVRQIRKAHRKQKRLNEEQTLFYDNASHQLKTPLTLIAGPVKELLDDKDLKQKHKTLAEIISRNVVQLEKVTTDVLNFKKDSLQTVSDESTAAAMQRDLTKVGHIEMLNQEDTEELSNILIVDDNDDMRRYLRTLLADRFYVLEASDGQSGLQLARESVPDLIVSDVMMPVMDGLQFCKQLKEDFITSHIPIILLTARSADTQQKEGYESGADAYLTKPFSAEVLIARIYNLLKSRQQLRHLFDGQQTDDAEQAVKLTTQDKLFIDTLKETVQKHMSNSNLKMDDLGEEMGISRVQLYRKIKTITGLSPVELLRQMRVQRGYVLLNSTTKTVSEIAYEVGFSSSSYFAHCFKNQFGKTPLEMRAK